MTSPIKAILFDLDGTIIDTTELVYQSYEYTLRTHKFPVASRDELAAQMGFTLTSTYQQLTGQEDVQVLFDCHDEFQSENINLAVPFKKLHHVLQTLKNNGIKMAVVTSRGRLSTDQILNLHNLTQYFDAVITCDDVTHPKPDAEPILKALETLQISPENALMTGDTKVDILSGKHASVKTIGVTHGCQGEEMRSYKPDYVISSLTEILTIM